MKKLRTFLLLIIINISLIVPAFADSTITIPEDTIRIESEAFMNDTSIDEVYLPDNLLTIRSKAFAYSSIKKL